MFALSRRPDIGRSTLSEFGIGDACDAGQADARRIVRSFVTRLKSSTTTEIELVVARVLAACEEAGLTDRGIGDDFFLDWEALSRFVSTGLITIGSHAHSHVPLPRLGRDGAIADLQRSVREIERHTIPVPSMFAYPNGDYDADVLDGLDGTGLKAGFTTEHGYVKLGDDLRRLPRVNIHEGAASTQPEFLCRILGIL